MTIFWLVDFFTSLDNRIVVLFHIQHCIELISYSIVCNLSILLYCDTTNVFDGIWKVGEKLATLVTKYT